MLPAAEWGTNCHKLLEDCMKDGVHPYMVTDAMMPEYGCDDAEDFMEMKETAAVAYDYATDLRQADPSCDIRSISARPSASVISAVR